jgi:hypothetical protein
VSAETGSAFHPRLIFIPRRCAKREGHLSREFDGHFVPAELTSLREWEIALKLPKRTGRPHPFKAYSLPLEWQGYGTNRRENIKAQSRMLFGRPRARVERSIARALSAGTHAQPTRPSPPPRAAKLPHEQKRQVHTTMRCTHCNEAGYLELRHKETGELLVHRCPHRPELIIKIEQQLKSRRLSAIRGAA